MISILVVTKSQLDLLRQCVIGIEETVKKLDYELLILGNNATDDVIHYLKKIDGKNNVRVQYSDTDLSFSRANNILAKDAKGDHLLLLNDDISPSQNWLDEMLLLMEEKDGCGIVGAKLVRPGSNTIKHCGVVFGDDRTPSHLLHGHEELDPRTCQNKRFQAVTGACMLIKKTVWDTLKGLKDNEYDPECFYRYEDIDFCLRAGIKGHKVWYAAKAVLGHYGASSILKESFKNIFKYLPEFKKEWADKIQADEKIYLTFPPMPHIMIGIPISEGYTWCVDMLLANLVKLRMFKGCITICFVVNNSGKNFFNKIIDWAQIYAKKAGFRNVVYPVNMFFENDKNKAVVMSRNIILKVAEEQKATHIFWWDCDVVQPEDVLLKLFKLISKENPVAMSSVWYKGGTPKPMTFIRREDTFDKFDEILERKDKEEIEDACTDRSSKCRMVGPYEVFDKYENDVETIDAGGLGSCLMEQRITEGMKFVSGDAGFGTEDLGFFYRLNKKGIRVKLDTTIKTVHLAQGGAYHEV